ncbi:hypothetical protein CSB45_14565 [candidate division KSB3 bacterium]|uniref:Phosphodiesterase n=1 Tax=candidate division KSB3 bacterium TaxID=2044937 RepID=A0A2G6E111_9BACT|nr:MAG: hypothetical protein CSB45_14565 [candidate division KSB3 bacterium]PIE28424.1 MAG: hypothetical protein CSA57_14005 [candidate division KSB3 bacterium]
MYFPNYDANSIVNLMSSVLHAFGGQSRYAPLPELSPQELSGQKNVILLVLDGFGYEFLLKQEKGSIFHKFLTTQMTSVFPSTTAAGITAFLTGLAPQQHAVTGWFMYLREFGVLSTSLRFTLRCGGASLSNAGITPDVVFADAFPTVFQQLDRKSYSLLHEEIAASEYTLSLGAGSQCLAFSSFPGCLQQIVQLCRQDEPKYIYAYWDGIDSRSHRYGTGSPEVRRHYCDVAEAIEHCADTLAGSDTMLIITADHGLIDTGPEVRIRLEDHPALQDTLTLPLSGESRAVYCYVRPSKAARFEAYLDEYLSEFCEFHRSEEYIRDGRFGLFEPSPRLFDRVGDYVVLMKENYTLSDCLPGKRLQVMKASHGGMSKEEIYVPLIVIEA